jgi:hypothetical protein
MFSLQGRYRIRGGAFADLGWKKFRPYVDLLQEMHSGSFERVGMLTKKTLTLSEELFAEIKRYRKHLNCSKIFREAVTKKLDELKESSKMLEEFNREKTKGVDRHGRE